jgi:hypothetical protein
MKAILRLTGSNDCCAARQRLLRSFVSFFGYVLVWARARPKAAESILMKVDSGEIYQKKKKKKLSNIPVLAKP